MVPTRVQLGGPNARPESESRLSTDCCVGSSQAARSGVSFFAKKPICTVSSAPVRNDFPVLQHPAAFWSASVDRPAFGAFPSRGGWLGGHVFRRHQHHMALAKGGERGID